MPPARLSALTDPVFDSFACSSYPTEYGVHRQNSAYGIVVTSLTGYTYTRQISPESSAIQYSLDLVSHTWPYYSANEGEMNRPCLALVPLLT